MAQFRKKQVVIEAFQLSYRMALGQEPAPAWFVDACDRNKISVHVTDKILYSQYCIISTLEGKMKADAGDFIIQGVNGEIYPCKPDIFEKTYEAIIE